MTMRMSIDNAAKNNQRSARDLATLYKRLILTIDRTVAPQLQRLQFSQPKYAKMLSSLQQTAIDTGKKYNQFLA